MEKAIVTEIEVGNRLRCKCGNETFFLALADEGAATGPLNNAECSNCHQMYHVVLERRG